VTDDSLAVVDQAFFQLRRMWAKPHMARLLSGQAGGKRIQLSNLMVISAVSRLNEDPGRAPEGPGDRPYAIDGPDAKPGGDTGGEPGVEVTVGAVAERLDVDPSTASRLVAHAIEAGLVARRPAPGGPPPAILELTAAGERVLEAMNMFRRHYLQRLMADWTDAERAEFAGLLRRFTDAALATPPVFAGAEKIFEAARSAPASRRH
jgi:DNA-binding MarR family transcriptional regulator